MNRGARRAPIFLADDHCHIFLSHLRELPEQFGVEVHAYSLMPNHYHLLLRSVRGQLSRAMRHLGAAYTQDVNRRNHWDGPVFKGRFRAQVIEELRHLVTVAAYIHLNPVKARLVSRLDQHAWTSHRAYLGLDPPPAWLSRDVVLGECGGVESFAQLVQDYRHQRAFWPEGLREETGWLQSAAVRATPWSHHQRRRAVKANTAPTVKAVLARVLKMTGVSERDLKRTARGRGVNAARRFFVWALATSTDLTQREIGECVDMSPAHAATTLARLRRQPKSLGSWREAWVAEDMLSV
jgi:REP element-mobilizing transposase RayT